MQQQGNCSDGSFISVFDRELCRIGLFLMLSFLLTPRLGYRIYSLLPKNFFPCHIRTFFFSTIPLTAYQNSVYCTHFSVMTFTKYGTTTTPTDTNRTKKDLHAIAVLTYSRLLLELIVCIYCAPVCKFIRD